MKTIINFIQLGAVLFSLSQCAMADEKNFGTMTPSADEVIQHLKVPAQNAEPSPQQSGDDYQDVSDGDLQNTRGIKINKTVNLDKIKIDKPKPAKALGEKAISLQILFDYDSATLNTDAMAQLDPIGHALASGELKGLKFKIEGHTDAVGSDDYNSELSRRRAEAVKQFLINQYGISISVLQSEGKGESALADSTNPSSEINRRVRIVSVVGE